MHVLFVFNNAVGLFFETCFLLLVIVKWIHGQPPQQTLLESTIAGDSFLGVLVGGNDGETISARAATARRDDRWWGCWLCNYFLDLFTFDPHHCDNAEINDRKRAQKWLDDLDVRILARHLEDGQWVRTP